MTLKSWLESRWLVAHEPTVQEIADLLAIAERDLEDAALDRLSPDWRLGIAYNAALQLATAALAAEGYRPGRDRAHYLALKSLGFTVAIPPNLVDTLDGIRRKRNQLNYERAGATSVSEAREVYQIAHDLRRDVLAWLSKAHPELLP